MYELRGALPGVATLIYERLNDRDRQGRVKESTRTALTIIRKPNKSARIDWTYRQPREEEK